MKITAVATAPISRVQYRIARLPARLQFAVFMLVTLIISLGLTALSYWLYLASGTAQLDLSRPGYKAALSEVGPSDDESDYRYAATGPLDKRALDEFKQKYDALTNKTKGQSAFDPGALSDDQLSLYNSTVVGPQ